METNYRVGSRKRIKWTSRRSESSIKTRSSPVSNISSDRMTTYLRKLTHRNTSTRKRPPAFPELLFRVQMVNKSEISSKPVSVTSNNLLSRRGIDQAKQQLLILQTNKPVKASHVIDPDFFDHTPADWMLLLENFSKATLGSSFGHLASEKAGLMLEHFSNDGIGCETPVCKSTCDKTIEGLEKSMAVEFRVSDFDTNDERLDSAILRYDNLRDGSFGAGAERPPGRCGFHDDASESEILRIENLSEVSLTMEDPVERLNASMIEIDRRFEIGSDSEEGPDSGRGLTARANGSSTVCCSFQAASSVHSQSFTTEESCTRIVEKAEKAEERKEDEMERDPFLYLAWTSVPSKSRTLRRRRSRTEGASKACALPPPHPDILAAEARISEFRSSPLAIKLDQDITIVSAFEDNATDVPEKVRTARERIAETSATAEFRDLLRDSVFVRMYTSEMQAMCTKGVWWEGWLVVEELKEKCVIGPMRDDS